jgi:tetratricopeptide (TPR) repeat protein
MKNVSFAIIVLRNLVAFVLIGWASLAAPTDTQPARSLALIGHNDLGLGRLDDAKSYCDAALKLDPANDLAKDCLRLAASMRIDRDLNDADAKILQRDYQSAIRLASKWLASTSDPNQKLRAKKILRRARLAPEYFFDTFVPDWLRQLLIAITVLTACALLLIFVRRLWRKWRSVKWHWFAVKNTRWRLLPLREATEPPTGIPTDHFLDALTRLPQMLKLPLWKPRLLLLRPTPPEDHDPAIIEGIISSLDPPPIVLWPEPQHLGLNFKEHDVQLDEAVQHLRFRVAAGLDLGSVANFLGSIVHWFSEGTPVISGIVENAADRSVSIHIAASRGNGQCVSVTARTPYGRGVDVIQLTAERTAFKLLLRTKYPEMTNNESEGFAALRQAVNLFSQYAGAARGSGENAQTRDSSLQQAARDFGSFRTSIPLHYSSSEDRRTSREHQTCPDAIITDEVRQAALLAEGMAHALAGGEDDLNAAVVRFRELQDWPGIGASAVNLRRQAAYNEAIVWRHKGSYQKAVLMLTELLGEHAPDTESASAAGRNSAWTSTITLDENDTMRFPARLARLSAFAQYTLEDWAILPKERIDLLISGSNGGEKLIEDLKRLPEKSQLSDHEQRIVQYIHLEVLRAIGHVEVLRAISGLPTDFYDKNRRPVSLRTGGLADAERRRLEQAIEWMKEAEEVLPTPTLYCDLAEANLLLRNFKVAGGWARHATLENQPMERAFYLASESYLLENTKDSHALAVQYASRFDQPTLPEFIALREELHLGHRSSARA